MKKRSGPDLTPEKIKTEPCPDCAQGFVHGMFHRMPCFTCNAVGRLKDGEALREQDAIVFLRTELNEASEQIRELHRNVSELRAGESGRGYGAGGSRYHGD